MNFKVRTLDYDLTQLVAHWVVLGIASVVGGWFVLYLAFVVVGMVYGMTAGAVATAELHRPLRDDEGRAPAGHQWLLWWFVLFMYLSVPVAMLLGALATAGVLVAAMFSGVLFYVVAVLPIAAMADLARGMASIRDEAVPGYQLDPTQQSRLQAVLHEVAQEVGTRNVDSVYLVPDATIAVLIRGTPWQLLWRKGRRCLLLGAATLKGLDTQSARAMMAREFALLKAHDAGIPICRSMRGALEAASNNTAPTAGWFIDIFRLPYLRMSGGLGRLQGVAADRVAMRLYGSRALVDGVRHCTTNHVWFRWLVAAVAREGIACSNIYQHEPSIAPDEGQIEAIVANEMSRKRHGWEATTSPAQRIAAAEKLGAVVIGQRGDHEDAWDLIDNDEYIERDLTLHLRTSRRLSLGW